MKRVQQHRLAIRRWALAATALVTAVSAGPAFAATISVSSTVPMDNVSPISLAITNPASGNNWKSFHDGDIENRGQTFNVGGSNIIADKISVAIRNLSTISAPLKFVLYSASQADDGGGTFPALSGNPDPGTIVAQVTGSANFVAHSSTWDYLTFDFDDVTLNAGEYYGFYVLIDGLNGSYGTWHIGRDGSETYTNGHGLRAADNFAFGAVTDEDTPFWLQTAIPEPSTSILGIAGLVGLASGWIHRRRGHMKICRKG